MRPVMETMAKKTSAIMKECYRQWKCADIMAKHEDTMDTLMVEKVFDVVQRKDERFNVLCHGDLWANNVMFKYNEDTEKVEECILVDFQMSFYNSPMLDLIYFIYSSTQHQLKLHKVDHIIQFYHQQLVANLKKLGYSKKPPTLLSLQRDYLELGLFGVVVSFGTFTIAVAPPGEDADMANFMKEDETGNNFTRRLYSNPAYVEAMNDLIPYFEMKGFLDL